ncbi:MULTISPECIES: GntR family transcriptional regulator [Bacillus]|uniref:GntR family transcriptional regulator n=1 Tax=Bacillus wiedmannii TaxID=1890302 RepID=A0ABX5DNN1_9BACI|nr:GntR family transcriptional regulator [Bacillus wiedmannii]PRT01319.1 GntR family transcriptional regulator [Bacillus wiedmannii]PRT35415.1 GntR family transcriptional regulator [Bacillus wiedmannii]
MRSDFSPNIPVYIQIIEYIKIEITSRRWSMGSKIPTVRELSTALQVNQNTIQRAFQELEKEKIIITRRGMGRYVTTEEERIKELLNQMITELIDNFINNMKNLNFNEETILLSLQSALYVDNFKSLNK